MPNDDRPENQTPAPPMAAWRERLYEVIFKTDTRCGKAFDVALLLAIVLSVLAVMLDSVAHINRAWGKYLLAVEWFFTILFTLEYTARLACSRRPWRYAVSFFGLVDLLAVLPTYLSIFIAGSHSLMVIRTLRLVRVFRVFKLSRYLGEARVLALALRETRARITVFLVMIMSLVLILGAVMYLVEGPESGFTSIPKGVYWAIVTMTTVGYGDIAPQTVLGQTLAAGVMILGYSIIIVPVGVFSVEIVAAAQRETTGRMCPGCGRYGHEIDSVHCRHCGAEL